MGRKRIWLNDAERKRAARAKAKAEGRRLSSGKSGRKAYGSRSQLRPFVSYDGEDIDGHYCILASSNGARVETHGRSITPEEFLRFAYDMACNTPGAHFVGFASTYDWERGFLRGLTDEEKAGVVETSDKDDTDWSTWYRLRRGGWNVAVHYRASMHLKIRVWNTDRLDEKPQSIVLLDCFKLFQSSFLRALEDWKGIATDEELTTLKHWKDLRGEFQEQQRAEISAYNDLENALMVKLMTRVRQSVQEAGLPYPTSWHGPGPITKAAFRKYHVKEVLEPQRRPEVLEAQLRAYAGGRFQCLQIGVFESIYDYDLRSAYPAAIWRLPSERGEWSYVKQFQQDHCWTVYHCRWSLPKYTRFGPFPFRTEHGSILYPLSGEGWYWHWEVEAALAIWGEQIEVLEGWRLDPEQEDCWHWIKQQAEHRVAIKKTDPGQAQVLKLVNNSAYGVLIQSVGKSPYTSPMLAGLITAWTRARLLDAAALDPEAIIGFATDGVFSTKSLPVQIGEGLGDWEEADGSGLPGEIYANGIYCWRDADGQIVSTRSRGIPRGVVDWDDLRRQWLDGVWFLDQTYEFERPISTKQALARNKPELAGTWQRMTRSLNTKASGWCLYNERLVAGSPRLPGEPAHLTFLRAVHGYALECPTCRCYPLDPEPGEVSRPYDRGLWGELLREIEEEELAMLLDEKMHDDLIA